MKAGSARPQRRCREDVVSRGAPAGESDTPLRLSVVRLFHQKTWIWAVVAAERANCSATALMHSLCHKIVMRRLPPDRGLYLQNPNSGEHDDHGQTSCGTRTGRRGDGSTGLPCQMRPLCRHHAAGSHDAAVDQLVVGGDREVRWQAGATRKARQTGEARQARQARMSLALNFFGAVVSGRTGVRLRRGEAVASLLQDVPIGSIS